MPSDTIRVDYKVLYNVASQFDQQQQDVQQILREVQASTDVLRQGGWISDAATQFYRTMDDAVLPRMTRLSKAMQTAATGTREIGQIMRAAEDVATASLKALNSGTAGGTLLQGITNLQNLAKGILPSGKFAGSVSAWEAGFNTGWAKGSIKVLGADASASYKTSIGKDGLTISGNAEASAYLAKGEFSAKAAGFAAAADGLVGVNAKASGQVVVNPFKGEIYGEAKGDLFAGARASASGNADLGIVKAGGSAGVQAGIGAGGHISGGYKDGNLSFDVGGQVALLVGVKLDFHVSIPVKQIGKDIASAGKTALNFAGSTAKKIGNWLF
jgi:WXG100 family type VII secretion target